MSPAEVIRHYRRLVEQYSRRLPYRPSRLSSEDVGTAREFLSWCRERQVDPKAFLDVRFALLHRAVGRVPSFRTLRTEKVLDAARHREASNAAGRTAAVLFDQTVRDLSLLSPSEEQVRRRYYLAGQQSLCAANDRSGGYHPRSQYCPSCPSARACEERIRRRWGFDVTALRAGRIAQLPDVIRRALRGWCGVVSV